MAAVRSRQALAAEGPNPKQAVAEALSAVNALAEMGLWPGPRDPANEAAVMVVRERWVRIQKRAMRDRAESERVGRAKKGSKKRPKTRSKISGKSGRSSPEKPKRTR